MVESRLIINSLESIQFILTNEGHTLNIEDLQEDDDIVTKDDLEARNELAEHHDFIACDISMDAVKEPNWIDQCCDNKEKENE